MSRDGLDQSPQNRQVAGEHQGRHQTAEATDPHYLGRGEPCCHSAGHQAPHGGGAQKDHGIQTQDAATLILVDQGLQDRITRGREDHHPPTGRHQRQPGHAFVLRIRQPDESQPEEACRQHEHPA